MSKRNKYSAGMLGAALIVGIGIGFCGGFVTGNRLGSKSAAETAVESRQEDNETALAVGESGTYDSQPAGSDSANGESEVEPSL